MISNQFCFFITSYGIATAFATGQVTEHMPRNRNERSVSRESQDALPSGLASCPTPLTSGKSWGPKVQAALQPPESQLAPFALVISDAVQKENLFGQKFYMGRAWKCFSCVNGSQFLPPTGRRRDALLFLPFVAFVLLTLGAFHFISESLEMRGPPSDI